METQMIPLPKDGYCVITLDHYIDLVRAQSKLEDLKTLIKEKQYDAVFELLRERE